MAAPLGKVDRQTTTPFHLKLFYQEGSFPPLKSFHSPLAPHLQIYTWPTCTLRELSHLLATSLPNLLPHPAIGTRLSFRLIYPDTRSTALPSNPNAAMPPGRYLSKDLGSVVLGDGGPGVLPADEEEEKIVAGGPMAGPLQGNPEVMLKDVKFVIGDYVAVAILPPLENGSVAPSAFVAGTGAQMGPRAGVRRERDGFGHGGRDFGADFGASRDNINEYQGFRGGRGRGGFGGPPGRGPRPMAFPSGEWRRGERLPEGPAGAAGGSGFRGGGGGGGYAGSGGSGGGGGFGGGGGGRGRDRDRW